MSDPVAWLVVERGWEVIGADDAELDQVEEVVGDSNRDIFNGLTIAHSLFSRGQYVPAEQVAEITDGRIRLAIGKDEVERLFATVRKREQRDPEQRSAGLAVSRTAVRQSTKSRGPSGLRG